MQRDNERKKRKELRQKVFMCVFAFVILRLYKFCECVTRSCFHRGNMGTKQLVKCCVSINVCVWGTVCMFVCGRPVMIIMV